MTTETERKRIWDSQGLFVISAQHLAEEVFENLDSRLSPQIMLIGIPNQIKDEREGIILEPEDCGHSSCEFRNIVQLARQLKAIDPHSSIHHTHPVVHEDYHASLERKALRDAISKTLERNALFSELTWFVSGPVEINDFLVFIVLELNKSVFESHYSLVQTHDERGFSQSTSLLRSTASNYLEKMSYELFMPSPGSDMEFSRKHDPKGIVKSAGNSFMYTVSSSGKNYSGLHGLFDTCNIISSLKYEGEEGAGRLLICREDHPSINMSLLLESPIKITEYLKIRKFLNLSKNDEYLISDSYNIFGIGKIVGNYNPCNENLFCISFTGHYKWNVAHDNNLLMTVSYNQPSLPLERLSQKKFYSDIQRIFPQISKVEIDVHWSILHEALKQKHGTMLVITEGAEEESLRLSSQCFKIQPTVLKEEQILSVTGIDGALILAPDGKCHALGAILDGIATRKGNSSRGARYNSAIKYYESSKYKCLAIVLSEDGMVDFVPDLKPQIKKSNIINHIEDLKVVNDADTIDFKIFNEKMEWLIAHQFYLDQIMCNQINALRASIDEKYKKQMLFNSQFGVITGIVRNDLCPDEEMDGSYFLPEESLLLQEDENTDAKSE